MDRKALGRVGEDAAAAALTARGYVILRRNVRSRYGEIDLVVAQGREIIFVEVKTRTSGDRGHPFDAVHPVKRRRLARLARAFVHERGLGDRVCRFAVVAVLMASPGRVLKVEIMLDAFEAPAG